MIGTLEGPGGQQGRTKKFSSHRYRQKFPGIHLVFGMFQFLGAFRIFIIVLPPTDFSDTPARWLKG